MRAIVIREHGDVDQLRLEEVPDPHPGPGEVRVRVRAVALNHLDIWTRKGIPGIRLPLPVIPGADIAGILDAVGPGVDWLTPGMEVALYPAVSCGHCSACIRGHENECRYYQVLGHRRDGGYADYIVVPAVNVLPRPRRLSWEETAAIPLVFLTAWHMLVTLARVQPRETVLVVAAGSGVGMAAIQIARYFGARVLATAGTESKRAKALELGAVAVFDHYQPGWGDAVLKEVGKRGIDVAFDHVGQATWPEIFKCLGWDGRLVSCGATSGTDVYLNVRLVFAKRWRIFGSYMGTRGELLDLWPLVETGDLKPVVDQVFPLEQAAAAHRYMEEKRHFGKVVLRVSSDTEKEPR